MKLCTSLVAALVVVAIGGSTAQAVVYWEDNLDGYATQAAAEAVWAPVGCSLSGLTAAQCTPSATYDGHTLSQDFPERGNTFLNVSPPGTPGSADSAQRNQIILTPAQTPPSLTVGAKVSFSFDFFDLDAFSDGTLTSPSRQNVSLQYRDPANGTFPLLSANLIAMGFNNNQSGSQSGGQFYMGRVLGYAPPVDPTPDPDGGPNESVGGSGAYFKLNDFATGTGQGPGSRPATTADWHTFRVDITTSDGLLQDYEFYVDGVLAERVNDSGPLRQYNTIRVGSGVSATIDAYYDNFKLEYFAPAPPANNADFNDDGTVDAADYVVWRKSFGSIANGSGTQGNGDADGDLDVDMDDYNKWVNQFGTSPAGSGGQGAVPEPASIVMLLFGVAALVGRRSR